MNMAGWNSNALIKGRLQAAIYYNKKRRLDKIEESEEDLSKDSENISSPNDEEDSGD